MSEHKHTSRCAAHCGPDCQSRRSFLQGAAILLATPALGAFGQAPAAGYKTIRACGPASKYAPVIKAAFVRRKGNYGLRWPGEVWDGEAAKKKFTEQIQQTSKARNIKLDLRAEPLYSLAESEAWIAEAKEAKADGILLLVHDRQDHAWPTAAKVADSGIPAVIWSPLGTSFTTNTAGLAERPGCVIFSTDDTRWLDNGLIMLAAGARMRRARAIVIAGAQRVTKTLPDLGIELQYVPATTFINEYNAMPMNADIEAMAADYLKRVRQQHGATREDVLNGVKSYFVASRILEREGGDAITMDCLGALGKIAVSLPCIAWSRMNDDGIPAACEADIGAVAAHTITQYLFDRPGFQQDPVADTADDTIVGAHCSCATKLRGFKAEPEPFDLIHHHGNRDAVPRTLWPVGERMTCLDVLPGNAAKESPTELLISAGSVVKNIDVPPSGGCVVSVKMKVDGSQKVLNFPGFHQLFILGDFKRELTAFCQLYNLKATIV